MRYYGDGTAAIASVETCVERQLEGCRRRQGRFARGSCAINMELMPGWSWWAKYGGKAPELQKVAMDILSLVAGACAWQLRAELVSIRLHSQQEAQQALNRKG